MNLATRTILFKLLHLLWRHSSEGNAWSPAAKYILSFVWIIIDQKVKVSIAVIPSVDLLKGPNIDIQFLPPKKLDPLVLWKM